MIVVGEVLADVDLLAEAAKVGLDVSAGVEHCPALSRVVINLLPGSR